MAATPLASSGGSPLDGPATCDARGMIEIHRLFRHSFGEADGLVVRVRDGDTDHAAVVSAQLGMISTALHAHHEGEDARLWSMLDARAPSCAVHVERMRAQHAEMLVQLDALDAALPAWTSAPGPGTAAPVRAALGGVTAALAVHLPDEEATIVPVMEHVVTEREQAWFGEHGRRATPRAQTWHMLGAILAAQPDGGVDWQRRNLPAPLRVLWRAVGARRYGRYRADLEGADR